MPKDRSLLYGILTASPEVKSERLMGADGLNQCQARKAIQDSDRERQNLLSASVGCDFSEFQVSSPLLFLDDISHPLRQLRTAQVASCRSALRAGLYLNIAVEPVCVMLVSINRMGNSLFILLKRDGWRMHPARHMQHTCTHHSGSGS